MTTKLPDDYDTWPIASKDAFWSKRRTLEQQAVRERMADIPDNFRDYRCKRHPECGLVLTVDPEMLYCHLCFQSRPYSELDKVGDCLG